MPYVALGPRGAQPPLSIHYEIWETRPAVDTPLVLVHELGGSLESFRAFGQSLATVCPVIAFDQRGAGSSEKPVLPFTLSDLADDIARLADALALPRPFHMMGLAMGALTALRFAARHNGQLASLVLCDGTPEINSGASGYLRGRAAAVRQGGMRAVADETFRSGFRGMSDALSNPTGAAYLGRFIGNAPESYAMQLEALAAVATEPLEFESVTCRTLALTGERDAIWPPAVGQALSSRLSNAQFEVLENAAHLPPIQNFDGAAARVARFLEACD